MSKIKSTLEMLSPKEREALANLHESDGFKALKKLCEYEIIALGRDALTASTMELKEILHGKAMMASHIPQTINNEWKRLNKDV